MQLPALGGCSELHVGLEPAANSGVTRTARGVQRSSDMTDQDLPFNPESIARLISTEPSPRPEGPAYAQLGCWGLSYLSSTLSINGQTRLVGRELESIRLLHAIDDVARGDKAVIVTMSGVPGAGKTRLIEDSTALAQVAGFEGRVYQVAAVAGDAPNAVIARLVAARFGLERKSSSLKRRYLLQRVGELLGDERVEDVCYFLGDLVGVAFEPTPLTRALTQHPFQAEMALQSVLCELFAADAASAPLCLVVEDLQNIDQSSLSILLALSDDLREGTLLVCSGSAEFFKRHEHFGETSAADHEHIELGPLDPSDVRNLLRQLVGPCQSRPEELEHYVVSAGLGNPGLIHELVRELWAYGALRESGDGTGCTFIPSQLPEVESSPRLKVAPDVQRSSLPGLHLALLEASAHAGSVCWLALSRTLLAVHSPELAFMEESAVNAALAELEAEGHILRLPESSLLGESEFLFRDPEARQQLSAQLSPSKRRALSRATADWLTQREAMVCDVVDLLITMAHHLAASGSSYRAALCYLRAADDLRAEGAMTRAAGCYQHAFSELGEQDNVRRVDALHDYGTLLVELGHPSQARAAFGEMAELGRRLGLHGKLGAALNRLGRIQRDAGELSSAMQTLEQALLAFEQGRDGRGIASTTDDLGKVLWLAGDRARAVGLLKQAFDMRKRAGDERSLAVSLSNLAVVWNEQGHTKTSERALCIASEIGERRHDARARCDALLVSGRLATRCNERERARQAFRDALQLAYTAKDPLRCARSTILLGVAELRCHDFARAEELLTRGGQLARDVEAWLDLAEGKRALAKQRLKTGQLAEARSEISAALRLARRARCPAQLASTLRTLAEIVAASEDPAAEARAIAYYTRGIELSKQLGDEHELAKGYRALSRFARRYDNLEIRRQSELLRDLSDELFERHSAPHAA